LICAVNVGARPSWSHSSAQAARRGEEHPTIYETSSPYFDATPTSQTVASALTAGPDGRRQVARQRHADFLPAWDWGDLTWHGNAPHTAASDCTGAIDAGIGAVLAQVAGPAIDITGTSAALR
jgi:hypothetical protein